MLSVIVVSRDRHDSLNRCLSSINKYLDYAELCVGFDSDDPKTKEIGIQHNAKVFEFTRQRNRHSGYINPIAEKCEGDFILYLNDDLKSYIKENLFLNNSEFNYSNIKSVVI